MLLRSVAATPEGAMVEPDCVRVGGVHGFAVVSLLRPPLSVKLDGNPAVVQLIARLDERIPDQLWPKHGKENKRKIGSNLPA